MSTPSSTMRRTHFLSEQELVLDFLHDALRLARSQQTKRRDRSVSAEDLMPPRVGDGALRTVEGYLLKQLERVRARRVELEEE